MENNNAGTAVAEPMERKSFKQQLAAITPRLKNLLPDYIAPERYLSLAMLAIQREPKLQQACVEAPESVINSILGAAQLGLEIGGAVPGAHLVPFKSKIPGTERYAMQCQLIPDYRGLVGLAVAGETISGPPDTRVVYDGEEFDVGYGDTPHLIHKPDFKAIDQGNIVAVYSVVQLPDGTKKFEVMTTGQVEKIRQKSKAKDAMAWSDNFGEMAKKTVLKRLLKLVPMNPNNDKARRLALAIKHDNLVEGGEIEAGFDFGTEEDASAHAARKTAARVDDLKTRMGATGRDVSDVKKEEVKPDLNEAGEAKNLQSLRQTFYALIDREHIDRDGPHYDEWLFKHTGKMMVNEMTTAELAKMIGVIESGDLPGLSK